MISRCHRQHILQVMYPEEQGRDLLEWMATKDMLISHRCIFGPGSTDVRKMNESNRYIQAFFNLRLMQSRAKGSLGLEASEGWRDKCRDSVASCLSNLSEETRLHKKP